MSGAIQKIDKSILDTARSDLSYAENMIIILCILTGEVGMLSEKYIDFFYYSISGQNIRLNRAGNGSKESFNTALQELLDSGHCIETHGGIQFYQKVFTADDDDKRLIKDVDTFKSFLKAAADKCEQSEDKCTPADDSCEQSDNKCEQSEDNDRNEIDDMGAIGVMKYVKHSFALDIKKRGCNGIVVYNAVDGSCRVLKGSKLADTVTNCVANGSYCENLQSDRYDNSDKLQGMEVTSDIYFPNMTRCLDFICGAPSSLKWEKVRNSDLELHRIAASKDLYDEYIASGKSVEGLGIPEEQQFTQAQQVQSVQQVQPTQTVQQAQPVKQVVKLPDYPYSVGDTLIIKGSDYCGKVEYTVNGWKILAGSICGKRGSNLDAEDAELLKNLGLTKQVDFTTRMFNRDVTVGTFGQAHALLAHQYNETIDTFVYDYTETLQPLVNVLTDSVSIRAMLSDGKSKRYSKLFEIEVDE
jgi:hypothetical protein